MEKTKFDFQKQPGKQRTRFYSPDPANALVSVITPFYNAGKYFEQTFNSMMNQTFPWFEWIIVDDGSPNAEDAALLHRLAAIDRRITVITQENAGPSAARNNAIAHANTELIVPLDADDLFDPTYLECLYWSMLHNPDAAWSYTNSIGFQEQEYIWNFPFSAETMKTFNFLNYTAMIRKQAILDMGGYTVSKQAFHEDWKFWLDMLAQGKKPVRVDSHLFWYRRLATGRMSSVNSDQKLVMDSDKIIEEAARNVDTSVQAKYYPVTTSEYPFYTPKFQTWDRPSAPEHKGKRVLWLIPWMTMGGADKFNLDAIAGLKAKGFENYILTTVHSDNEWRQRFEDYTDEIFALPDFLDPAHYMEFVSYFLQSREIDVILLTNSYDGYYMMPWLRQHFPDVAMVDYIHMEEWYWRAGGYARTSAALPGVLEKTYVCNSATRDVMINHFGRTEESVDCLHIGVDHHHFSKEAEPAGYLHNLLNLPQDRKIVLFPCRVHPQKRPLMMLDIAEATAKLLPDVAFVVAGNGSQFDAVQAGIKERNLQNTVYCIGETDNMRSCYRDSDLTLICSLKEGLALTAYESLSMGVPVVSSDVGGQRDLVGSDVGALLPLMQQEEDIDRTTYAQEEIQQYVDSIVAILGNDSLRATLSRNARSKIENGFSIENMVNTLANELETLCSDPARIAQRRALSQMLCQMPALAAEYYTIYQQWSIQTAAADAIWQIRCRLLEENETLTYQNQELSAKVSYIPFSTLVRMLLGKLYRGFLRLLGLKKKNPNTAQSQ